MMKAKTNEEKAILECYVRLYKAAEPSIDFNELLNKVEDEENPFYDSCWLEPEKREQIIEDCIKEFKIKP